ncbi:MAG TPA: crossover junction endodeoxyribonuclease RuvC [Actinobacteria bacterium]|nr:crossover junction endodeoxyribonuclease RuvC [Actinomycetes bacterium]HEX21047.1 crossover junction endodeoxyribonuclease RuvC [Actinomycetota bacterium]
MQILGIDPGTATTGYGLISKRGGQLRLVDYGVIKTAPKQPDYIRLQLLYRQLVKLLERYKPSDIAVEQLFFNTNVTTAMSVGQARGVILLAAADAGVNIGEYTPLQIKQAITGYGRASKTQIQQMVKVMLGMDKVPKPDDAADAIAVAICYANSALLAAKLRQLR